MLHGKAKKKNYWKETEVMKMTFFVSCISTAAM